MTSQSEMTETECRVILQLYPEMILLSRQPFTWKGFLNCRSDLARNIRIKMKLVVPYYPSLHEATIYFGERIGERIILCANFTEKVGNLITSSKNVLTLLRQLQSLIVNQMSDTDWDNNLVNITEHQALDIVGELTDTFKFEPMEARKVRLFTDSNLYTIKLVMNGISLKLRKTRFHDCRWKVVSSDLPQTAEFGPFERNLANLHTACSKFKLQVEIFEESWNKLKEIDENCWVLDPVEPNPSHLYRRIYLTDSLSVLVKLYPLNPNELPEIKFLGCEDDAREREDVVSSNAYKWDPDANFLENLRVLLEIATFPQKEENRRDENEKTATVMVSDEECCICFSLELNREKLPNVICNNERCRRHFHAACLVQCLQTVACSHFFSGYVHGVCPHCGESISCAV